MIIHSPKELGRFAYCRRKEKKLSQLLAGSKVGLKQTTVSKFEIRPQTTKLDTLFRILSVLDLEMRVSPKPQNKKNPNANQVWIEEW